MSERGRGAGGSERQRWVGIGREGGDGLLTPDRWSLRERENKKRRLNTNKEVNESWVGDRRKIETSNIDERSSYG